MHGTGPVLRALTSRANTWQQVLIAVALIAAGAVLVALGHLRWGLVGIVGLLLLWSTVRHRFFRRAPVGPDADGDQP